MRKRLNSTLVVGPRAKPSVTLFGCTYMPGLAQRIQNDCWVYFPKTRQGISDSEDDLAPPHTTISQRQAQDRTSTEFARRGERLRIFSRSSRTISSAQFKDRAIRHIP
jgi:hypothetical protein